MARRILEAAAIHEAIVDQVGGVSDYQSTVDEVIQAVAQHAIVVVGMKQNPFPKKACKLLEAAGLDYHYLEYGSYFAEWKRRGALKMWSGWQTFPMVFVKGRLVGGFSDLKALADSGELNQLLS